MSRGIGRLEGMVGDMSRGTVVGIDEMVDVEVLDCVGWGILVQPRLFPFLPYLA